MRIKHWQGYGYVTAKKLGKKNYDGRTVLKVEVSGNHEWGLVREDKYDLKRWLVDKFDKGAKDIWPYDMSVTYEDGYRRNGNIDEEYVVYTFEYST